MIIEKIAGHVAFQFEADEEFFELGYKVLNKQQIKEMLPCIHVQYNMRDRLLYDIEQYTSLEESVSELNEKEALRILYSFFQLLLEVGSNGFVPLEAVQVGSDMIFWDSKAGKVSFIVLPIAKEYNTRDYRSWNKRMWDMLNELCNVLTTDKEEIITKYLSGAGKLLDNISELMPVLEKYIGEIQKQKNTHMPVQQKELQLLHDGKYGQFAFYIRKKEFLIGKRRDSVDGYLGVSEAVSRLHCRIVRHDDRFWVTDMGSSNHTYVNGTLVREQEERELGDGDKLRIADIDFKVRIVDI